MAVVAGNARGCTPSPSLTAGPSDSLAFYLSGSSAEGVAAFPGAPAVTYGTSPFSASNGALVLALGSYLSVTPGVGSALLAVQPAGNSAWSVSAWVKCAASLLPSPASSAALLSWGASGGASSAALALVITGQSGACDNKWHHVALTHGDGGASSTKSYVDGLAVSTTSQTLALPSDGSGALSVGSSSGFAGSLAELRLYNRALSAAEALALSQPPLAALGAAANAMSASSPSTGATSYAFTCAAGTRGSGVSLVRSAADGSWGWAPGQACDYCPPGTYSVASAPACALCPDGTYGNRAGLTSPACSGKCPHAADCPAGTAYPPPSSIALSCASGGARALPTSLGMRLWPAAHPTNPQHIDLIVAPADVCAAQAGQSCAARASVVMGGATLFVVGTAAELHMEPAEDLTCAAVS
jgi:hypothetical protein